MTLYAFGFEAIDNDGDEIKTELQAPVLLVTHNHIVSFLMTWLEYFLSVKSVNCGHQVNSDIHLQTVEIQMSRLIRIFTVCLVNLLFQ